MLAEDSTKPHHGRSSRRTRRVLHVNDLAIFQLKGLRPLVALSFPVRPGEHNDDAVPSRLDPIKAVIPITDFPSSQYPSLEDLTGLIRPVSGGWPREPGEATSPPPLHVRVYQRDERLHIPTG